MRIGIVGGGPAGLYFALLMKRQNPAHSIRIIEQNPAGATFGFGVVFSDRALGFLQAHCRRRGVELRFEERLSDVEALADCDLVVGVDGVNSVVRETYAQHFQPSLEVLRNRYIWYGTEQPFDCLTLTFRENHDGAFVAHHYRYSENRSTFIVECDAPTWERAAPTSVA